MTSELLASIAGIVLSVAFSYIPGLAEKWAALPSDKQRLYMLGIMAVAALAVFGLTCAGLGDWAGVKLACTQSGALELIKIFVFALMANQAAYAVTPRNRPAVPAGDDRVM
jgi:hypothetical protein